MTVQPDAAIMSAARDAFFNWSKRNHVAGQEAWIIFRDAFTAGARAERERLEMAGHGAQPTEAVR